MGFIVDEQNPARFETAQKETGTGVEKSGISPVAPTGTGKVRGFCFDQLAFDIPRQHEQCSVFTFKDHGLIKVGILFFTCLAVDPCSALIAASAVLVMIVTPVVGA